MPAAPPDAGQLLRRRQRKPVRGMRTWKSIWRWPLAARSACRYLLSGVVANAFGQTFPWGTLIINVTGSFVIGFFGVLTGPDGRFIVGGRTRQPFVMIGLCGGYTTFS